MGGADEEKGAAAFEEETFSIQLGQEFQTCDPNDPDSCRGNHSAAMTSETQIINEDADVTPVQIGLVDATHIQILSDDILKALAESEIEDSQKVRVYESIDAASASATASEMAAVLREWAAEGNGSSERELHAVVNS